MFKSFPNAQPLDIDNNTSFVNSAAVVIQWNLWVMDFRSSGNLSLMDSGLIYLLMLKTLKVMETFETWKWADYLLAVDYSQTFLCTHPYQK